LSGDDIMAWAMIPPCQCAGFLVASGITFVLRCIQLYRERSKGSHWSSPGCSSGCRGRGVCDHDELDRPR
jgi:hypothetical protein